MANQEYVPFTGKLDAATEFEPFNGTLDGQEPSLTARVKQGVGRAVDSAQAALTDSPSTIAHIAAQQARNALPQTEKQQRMAQEMAPYVDAANKSEGVVDTVKTWGAAGFKRAGQLMSNPGEAGKMIAEQLPNALPGLAGGFAGAKLGAMAGTAVAPGVGTVVGGILGGVAGGFAGGYGLEKGSAMLDQVQKEAQARQINLQDESSVAKMVAEKQPEFEAAAQRKGVGTAGTDAVLNVATMGLAGMGGRTLAKEAHALSASVKAGTISATDAATELARLQAANAARNTLGAKALRHSGVAGAEMAGEGFTEGVGQKYAYGSVDAGDVIDESLLGLGTGAAMAMSGKAFNKAAGIVDQDATTRSLAATQEGLRGLGGGNSTDGWTTSPGAADPAPSPPGAGTPPPEAPGFTTSPGAAPDRSGGMDYQRDIPTDGLSLVDAAAQDRARAATVDFGQADTTAGWDTSLGAAAPRVDGIDMGREFDTSGLELDNRLPSERMGINPSAGPLSRAATIAVDSTPAQEATFIGRTGRDLQANQPKTDIENDNVIDVQGSVVDDRAISTPRRIEQGGPVSRIMAAPLSQSAINSAAGLPNVQNTAPAADPQAQAAPTQTPEAARGNAPAQTAAVPAAGTGAVQADGVKKSTGKTRLNDGISDHGRVIADRFYSTGYPWNYGYEKQESGGSVAQDGKDIIAAMETYGGAGMKLRDAIRHAEIVGDPVPDEAYQRLESLKKKTATKPQGALANVPQPAQPGTQASQTPSAQGAAKTGAVTRDSERQDAPSPEKQKALDRIASGKAWFGSGIKAQQFIRQNGLKDTHTVKKTSATRFDVVENETQPATQGATSEPQASQAQQAAPQRQETPAQPYPAVAGAAPDRTSRIETTLANGGHIVGNELRMANGMTQMKLTPDELAAAPATAKRARPDPEQARTPQPAQPAPAVERHPNWRKNAIQAGRVAKSLGIDPTGKRLAQMVEEIDARDTRTPAPPAPQPTTPQQDGNDFLPEGWTKSVNGFTKRPVYRMEQGVGQPFAVVTQTEGMTYEVQIRHGDKQLTTGTQRGALSEVLAAAKAELGRMKQADSVTHADPGEKAEAATPAVVTDSLKKAARNEDTKPSEMRKWLVAEIDKELLQAADRPDYDEAVKRMGEKDAISGYTGNGPLGKNSETGYITFDVPGDGKYKVRNSVRGLLEFRKNVMASQGFKDGGQKRAKPEQNDGVQGGSGGNMTAITNMVEEGDFEAARDYAEAVGVSLEDVKVPRGDMKPAWEKFLKDGTLLPAAWMPSKEWQFQDIGASSFVPDSEKRSATLTRVADGSTYVATVKGNLEGTSASYTVTKDGKEIGRASSRRPFSDTLRMAENAMPAANDNPAPSKASDTGWNMAGTGYGGKRYIGRNITLDDGREVVARVYENAGNYDEVEIKVDGARKFTVRDSFNAQDKADAFIKTLTSKAVMSDWQAAQSQQAPAATTTATVAQQRAAVSEPLPPTDIRMGDKVMVDGEMYTVTGPIKEGRKSVGVVADRDADTDPLMGVRRVFLRGDDAIRAKIAANSQSNEQATAAQQAPAATAQPEAPKLTQSEAKSLMAWQDMGQKDGVKTHALTFYESQADKDAKRGRMIVAKVSKGDRSANNWMVEGDDKPLAVLGMAKKRAEEIGMAKAVADGFVEQVAPASLQDGITQAQANAARFEIGKSLTKEQRKQVLDSLVDVYKSKGAEREFKGQDGNGNDRYGYAHSPDLFEKSDITGAMVRYYVTLPDGRIAHPTELFPDVSASDIERMALEQEANSKSEKAFENAIKPFYQDFDSANLMTIAGQVVISKGDRFAIIPNRVGAVNQARQQGWELAKPAPADVRRVLQADVEGAVADGFVEKAAAESDYASTAEQVEAAQELLLPIRQGEMITDDVRQTLESLLKIPSLKGFDQPTARRLLMIAGATKAAIEKVMRTNPVSIDDLATELGKATGEAEKKKAFDRAFNAASQIAQTDPKVKELLDIYNVEKSILDGIASERGLYGMKWAERNVSSRWTGQSQKVRSVKQRLVDAVNKAAPSGVRQSDASAAPKSDTVALSSVIDKMNAKNGQGLTDADRVPEQKPASKTPTIDRHNATMAAVREGKATAEQFRASFEQVVDGKAAIVAELDTMTKVQLLREGGTFVQMRYANEKKADVVDAVYRKIVGEYALGESVTYGIGRDSYQNAVRKLVEATDADKLAQYVKDRQDEIAEAQARGKARAAALENPKTLDDFRNLLDAHMRTGKTRKESFLMLTPDQRIQYDTLEAESTREARENRKRAQKTEVRAAGQTTAGEIVATKHTRDGYDLFVVKLADRLSKEDYSTVLASAKKLGGWYSAFRGNGAIPGFQFKDKANADAFLALAGGDTAAAQEQVAQRRDAFEDDRSQTAVERLRAMADKLEEGAAEVEGQERKTNTARRARFASAAMASAAADKAKAKTMRNIAQAIEAGDAKFLDAVRTKSQVDMLTGIVDTAKGAELRAKYPSYADQEKRKGAPPTAETADFADFPSYGAFRSDLATLGRQLLEVDGTKKLGQRLMSVADDVTDAYLEFAKANIQQVSQFGRGDALADFASKDEAERAIKRSGLTGKAIVLSVKRGQNRVILSPSEAIGRGLWQGDGDKRITLTAEFGAELVEAIGRRGNKQNQLSVPWQFQNAYDRRKALSRIGIETPSEFRAALREFIGLKEQAVANRTRELELQMVGRKADGLDFFPTSAEVADQMIEAADVTPDMAVLEPSAGMGHLADRIREAGAEPDVIEISADRRALLEEKGYTTQAVDDFLDLKPREFYTFGDTFRAPDGAEGIMRGANGNRVRLVNQAGDMVGADYYDRADLTGVAHNGTASGYDRIIMNPPFSNRRDAEHVRHAYSLLKPGGRIVAIMGEGVFFGQDKKAQDFREWLELVGGTSEKLPEGSFMDPSLPVNTSVNARMVVIDKPTQTVETRETDNGVAMFSRSAGEDGKSSVLSKNGTFKGWPRYNSWTRAEYNDVVSLLPAEYRNDPHRREPLSPADRDARAAAALPQLDQLNAGLPKRTFTVDQLGNIAVDARNVGVLELQAAAEIADQHGLGIYVTGVQFGKIKFLQAAGFVSEAGLGAVLQRAAKTNAPPMPHPSTTMGAPAYGTIMSYKPRGFSQVMFSFGGQDATRTPARKASDANLVATQQLVDGLKEKWTNAPEIIVARNMQDAQIPQSVRDYDQTLKSQGATGEARGFIYKGKVYLLADQLNGPHQIAEVLFHEVLGHYGLRRAFGKGLTPILQQVATMRRKEMQAKAKEYGLDLTNERDRLTAAEEILAEMAQATPEIGFVKRAIAVIRNWMRANVPGFQSLRLTDNDIIQAYILPARGAVTRSKETGLQSIERAMGAFSRGTNKAVTNPNDVVGNQGGRSADDTAPGEFAMAGDMVDGLLVRDEIPNQGSIGSSIDDYTVLRGIREIPLTAFTQLPKLKYYSISEEARTKRLAEQIKASGEINPLIVVIDKEGPYVLEGGHRFDALREIGKTSFPALVVLDNESLNEPTAPDSGGAAFSRTATDQTQTEAFKRWFGGSKVVDDEGKPLEVFHGTIDDFSVFDESAPGHYFTPDPFYGHIQNAHMLPAMKGRPDAAGSVMSVYLRIENPYYSDRPSQIEGAGYDREWVERLKSEGYDGIIHAKKGDLFTGPSGWGNDRVQIMVFDSKQIKSAIGNNGSFDPANPDIRFSRANGTSAWDAPGGIAARMGGTIKAVTATNIKERAGFKLTDYLGLGLQLLGRRQLVDIYGDTLPLDQYNRLAQQMEADKNEVGAKADALATAWAKLPDERQLAELMHDATLAQMDPAKPLVAGDNAVQYGVLRKRFNDLTPEAQKVYLGARDSYQAHHKGVLKAIKERIERSELKGPRKAALLAQMDDEFYKAVKGVYFPLARFGQYVVVTTGPDGKVANVSRAETMNEGQATRKQMLLAFPASKGYKVGKVILSKEFVAGRDAVGRGFMTELYAVLDKQDMDAAARAELEDTLGQLYLSSLPDLSWAKHGIHRKGTPGYSQDARRAFAQNMFHGARYLAKLRYSDLMQDELTAMQKHVDDWVEVPDADFNSARAQRVVDEFNKRHEAHMNPKSNPLSTALTSFGFIFHLGLSPASALVNLTQTALVAYPVMGAKWGFDKSAAALMKASQQAVQGKNDITGSLNEEERRAYDEAVRNGTIDVTMAHDLAGISQGEDAGVMWKIRPVMKWASFMFHHAERFNRQVTFVASYRLAREAGAAHEAAFEQATKATYDSHFDYSSANRPRVMQGNAARVLLLFKQYGQNMVYSLARSAQQSLKGATPQERTEARRVLGGLLAMHGMAAGALGLPMVTTLLAVASMLGGSDDEPWDAQVALQNMLADTFGQKPAEVLSHGLSRLTPWDISGRVGLDKLILPDIQEGLEGQRLGESAMAAALGPVAGIGINVLRGMQDMGNGHYLRGLESMLPAVLRGPMKALRYADEGAQDKTGVSIQDEVSPAAIVGQALGFSPSEVRLATEGKSAIMGADRALNERRSHLVAQFAMAAMAQDAEGQQEARDAIARFNEKNPGRRINSLQLAQSVRNRTRRIEQAQDGVYLPKNRRDAMDAGRFAGAE